MINLGNVKEGVKVSYEIGIDLKKVPSKFEKTCPCVSIMVVTKRGEKTRRFIRVTFKPIRVPRSVRKKGYYLTEQKHKLSFTDGTKMPIEFKAKVVV